MEKIKIVLITILLTAIFSSCKKTSTSTSPASPATNPNSTISPSSATSYYGIFSSGKSQSVLGGILQSSTYFSDAYFSSAAVVFNDWNKAVTVDSVKANGRQLKYISSYYDYEDTAGLATTFPITWHIVGNNGIPSFTYTDNALPTYCGYGAIPDTVDHAVGFSFPLTGVSSVDGISVLLDDGSHYSTTVLGTGVTSVTVSASAMSQFVATNTGNISITFSKKNVENVYGKAINFKSSYTLRKVISIK